MLVAGTRPEVVKMAPVYFELRESRLLEPLFLTTAQHRGLLDQALSVFGIVPDHDLDLMRPGQDLPDLTASIVLAVSTFLRGRGVSAVLVQGDTSTVFASALAAFYERIPVGHVEAGLRTHNPDEPWPEEMNRRLTAPLARWNFAPTRASYNNLLDEGIPPDWCHVTGNTVIDALHHVRLTLHDMDISGIARRLEIPPLFVQTFLDGDAPLILVTSHRRESHGNGLENICQGLLALAESFPTLGILYPVHPNPHVRLPVHRLLAGHPRILLTDPCGYEDFIWLMNRSRFVLSDSGGVQEEAPGLGKPVLVMRNVTERPEGVEAGTCRLVGTDPATILREASILLNDRAEYSRRSRIRNPYGDGRAAARICAILEAHFSS